MGWDVSPAVDLTREQMEQRRLAAAKDLQEGDKTQTEIAKDHGVTRFAVSKWKRILEEEGLEGLRSTNDEGNQGPDPKLSEDDKRHLADLLAEGAQAHGWETDLWTSHRVAELIERAFDVAYTSRHCSRILHELGFRPVKPQREAREKDEAEKRRWLHEEGDELKKT
jgi:transposase